MNGDLGEACTWTARSSNIIETGWGFSLSVIASWEDDARACRRTALLGRRDIERVTSDKGKIPRCSDSWRDGSSN